MLRPRRLLVRILLNRSHERVRFTKPRYFSRSRGILLYTFSWCRIPLLQIPECFDLRTQLVQALSEIFVAAVDIVDIAEDRRARSCKHEQHEDD